MLEKKGFVMNSRIYFPIVSMVNNWGLIVSSSTFIGDFDDLNARTHDESIDFETSSVLSTLSSLDGDTDPTLLNQSGGSIRMTKSILSMWEFKFGGILGVNYLLGATACLY